MDVNLDLRNMNYGMSMDLHLDHNLHFPSGLWIIWNQIPHNMCTCHNPSSSLTHWRWHMTRGCGPCLGSKSFTLPTCTSAQIPLPFTTDTDALQPLINQLLPRNGDPLHIAKAAWKTTLTLKLQPTSTRQLPLNLKRGPDWTRNWFPFSSM